MGIVIPTEQGFNMQYFYGEEELKELLVLVKKGGKLLFEETIFRSVMAIYGILKMGGERP